MKQKQYFLHTNDKKRKQIQTVENKKCEIKAHMCTEGKISEATKNFTITITEEDKSNSFPFETKMQSSKNVFFFQRVFTRASSSTRREHGQRLERWRWLVSTRACSPLRAVGAWARRSADCPSSIRRFESACGGVGIAIISNEKRMELLMTSTTRFVDGTARAFAVGLGGLHGRGL